MSIKNYRFVSPGVFVNEIDNSQLPASPAGIGPVIIGRAEKGPALRPITVDSFEEFVNVFGSPDPGNSGGDVWRQGASTTATTYGAYAAQAYLRNSAPLTYIRLLGAESDNYTTGMQGTGGEAGWDLGGNAYGIFLFQTASAAITEVTGALAGILYGASSAVEFAISGTSYLSASNPGLTSKAANLQGSDILLGASTGREFKLVVTGTGVASESITVNFTENDSKYIRKALNTNAQLLNSRITSTDNQKDYILGETFDRHVEDVLTSGAQTYVAVSRLTVGTGTAYDGADHLVQMTAAQTPQIVSCRVSPTEAPVKLFKFVARDAGAWSSKNLKISIQDIKRSPTDETDYGTFSVVIRHMSDSDNVVRVVEQFNNCDLNPNSLNYVARKIGDYRETWSQDERRYVQAGNYPNNSNYVYVDMNSDVDAGNTNPVLLPFGFEGIVKYQDEARLGSQLAAHVGPSLPPGSGNWVSGSGGGTANLVRSPNFTTVLTNSSGPLTTQGSTTGSVFIIGGSQITASVAYPDPILRVSASDGNLANPTDAYFGIQTSKAVGSTVFDRSTIDLYSPRGGAVGEFSPIPAGNLVQSQTFTLDDIARSGSNKGFYVSGSHAGVVGRAPVGSYTFASGAISGVLDAGYDRFTVPLYGGHDGLNIKEMDPFTQAAMITSPTDRNDYAFFSIRRAIDSVADPEVVEMNLAAIPGQTQEGLTTHLVRTCEDRADALAVIDLPDAFVPREDSTAINRNNTQSTITTLINGLRSRGLNTSYGCAYYPWVRARDTINGQFLWLPPSVAAIGTFSSSQRRTQVWFAPAGFNRGGLTEGSAGIPVVDVAHQLRRKDRDDLYSANINPIAKFPAEGVVIFGQKTLQVTPSALDRINVRRLMIFVKKRISQIASGLLFDPNVQQTWKRFTSQVNPFLADVKTNFGLSDYRVVLDETTTTPDLVDRNILYAQIYLKPTRAIEFIAIDFNITRTGASFDD